MKKTNKVSKTAAVVALAGVAFLVATVSSFAVVITQADGWSLDSKEGLTTVTTPAAGEVNIAFQGGTSIPTPYARAIVVPESSDAAKPLTGDYQGAGVKAISFKATSSGAAAGDGTRLVLRSGSREWRRYSLNIPASAGTAANRIGLALADGWQGPAGDAAELAAMWAADVQDVTAVELVVVKTSLGNHSFTISDFAIESDRSVGSIPTMEDALLAAFGVSSLAEVDPGRAAEDDDEDGLNNLDEILAEFDAGYFEQTLFQADVAAVAGGFKIAWACRPNKTYTVMRSTNLSDPDSFVGVYSVSATEACMKSFVDMNVTAEGQYFYKVDESDSN